MIKVLLAALILCLPVEATSYGKPERSVVNSPNGEFILLVDPETEKHVISAASHPGVEVWSFTSPVWHSPFLLSNDGQTVALVEWRHIGVKGLGEGDSVIFFRSGMPEKGIPFE